eukprot:1219288-Rhodomonas_salina.3
MRRVSTTSAGCTLPRLHRLQHRGAATMLGGEAGRGTYEAGARSSAARGAGVGGDEEQAQQDLWQHRVRRIRAELVETRVRVSVIVESREQSVSASRV